MNFMDTLQISSSGLTAQRTRMNVVSSNLANATTTKTEEGGPFKRKVVVFAANPVSKSFEDMLEPQTSGKLYEVQVSGIYNDARPPVSKYNPQHPDADKNGYVLMPNINIIEEMVNMMDATRSYEANVMVVSSTKHMASTALEIGK